MTVEEWGKEVEFYKSESSRNELARKNYYKFKRTYEDLKDLRISEDDMEAFYTTAIL